MTCECPSGYHSALYTVCRVLSVYLGQASVYIFEFSLITAWSFPSASVYVSLVCMINMTFPALFQISDTCVALTVWVIPWSSVNVLLYSSLEKKLIADGAEPASAVPMKAANANIKTRRETSTFLKSSPPLLVSLPIYRFTLAHASLSPSLNRQSR